MSSEEVVFLYPGQGSQEPGMLRALPDTPPAQQAIEEATGTLGGIDELDTATALEETQRIPNWHC